MNKSITKKVKCGTEEKNDRAHDTTPLAVLHGATSVIRARADAICSHDIMF